MSKKSYTELLKHPKWQKKRLEVLERESFRCEKCDTQDITLHVHHGHYEKGRAPWEYSTETLHCLCENCHSERHALEARFREHVAALCEGDLMSLLGMAVALRTAYEDRPAEWSAKYLESYEEIWGACVVWERSDETIDAADAFVREVIRPLELASS